MLGTPLFRIDDSRDICDISRHVAESRRYGVIPTALSSLPPELMATPSGMPVNMAEALANFEAAEKNIKSLLKAGVMKHDEAKRASNRVKKDFTDYMRFAREMNKEKSKSKKRAVEAEGDEDDNKTDKELWPCSKMDDCVTVQEYDSYEDGIAAVKAAFQANSLFSEVTNCKEDATTRAKKPGGSGSGKRGYLDWEFAIDNKTFGCRCAIR